MYSKKHIPNHTDYTSVEILTEPNRSYSIAELLARVVRNQPLPQLTHYSDDGLEDAPEGKEGHLTDDQVIEDMDKPRLDPFLEADDAAEHSKYRQYDD